MGDRNVRGWYPVVEPTEEVDDLCPEPQQTRGVVIHNMAYNKLGFVSYGMECVGFLLCSWYKKFDEEVCTNGRSVLEMENMAEVKTCFAESLGGSTTVL